MSLFRRKYKAVGKGSEEIVALQKEFEVLNCTPLDYRYTDWYADFLSNAESIFRKAVHRTPTDDLSGDMLDSYIDSVTGRMKRSGREQYDYHMNVIRHNKGLLDGELVLARGHLRNLREDERELSQQIEAYKNLKQRKNIL